MELGKEKREETALEERCQKVSGPVLRLEMGAEHNKRMGAV